MTAFGLPSVLVPGGCSEWQTSMGGDLGISYLLSSVRSLTMITYEAPGVWADQVYQASVPAVGKEITTTCSSVSVATSIVAGFLNRTHTNGKLTIPCNGVKWTSRLCPGAKIPSLCNNIPRFPVTHPLGCIDPCVVSLSQEQGGVDPQCPNLNILSPCGSTGYGCNNTLEALTAYRILAAEFLPRSPPPTVSAIIPVTSLATTTSVALQLALKGSSIDGSTVYCAAFAAGGSPPNTTDVISQQNYASEADATGSVTVTIHELSPATSYDAYCYTESPLGIEMDVSVAVQTKVQVATACCKTISVLVDIDSLYQGTSAAQAVSVYLDALPPSTGSISINLFVTVTDTSGKVGPKKPLQPASLFISGSGPSVRSYSASIVASSVTTIGTRHPQQPQ